MQQSKNQEDQKTKQAAQGSQIKPPSKNSLEGANIEEKLKENEKDAKETRKGN